MKELQAFATYRRADTIAAAVAAALTAKGN
jgi:hypothetical protein